MAIISNGRWYDKYIPLPHEGIPDCVCKIRSDAVLKLGNGRRMSVASLCTAIVQSGVRVWRPHNNVGLIGNAYVISQTVADAVDKWIQAAIDNLDAEQSVLVGYSDMTLLEFLQKLNLEPEDAK